MITIKAGPGSSGWRPMITFRRPFRFFLKDDASWNQPDQAKRERFRNALIKKVMFKASHDALEFFEILDPNRRVLAKGEVDWEKVGFDWVS